MNEQRKQLSYSNRDAYGNFWDRITGQINKAALTLMAKEPGATPQAVLETVRNHMQNVLDVTTRAMENLEAMQTIPHYQPAENEPSIFGRERGQPSTDWIMWRSNVAKTSIIKAYEEGVNIIEELRDEFPRDPASLGEEPPVSFYHPEFAKAGIKRHVLSFAWVIYAKYRRDLDWYETQKDGEILMNELGRQ